MNRSTEVQCQVTNNEDANYVAKGGQGTFLTWVKENKTILFRMAP